MDAARSVVGAGFGKYTLVAKIARGGMAEILLARQQGVGGFEKLLCIKRILPDLAKDPHFIAMFLDEARTAARISHPNVCQVFDVGEVDGHYFMAMEYLEGVPLAVLRRKDLYPVPPDPQLVVGIAVQMCEGLNYAHDLTNHDGAPLEVVHRDVSGQNVFVTRDGMAKVLDFGIARVQDATMHTSAGVVKGTYAYMSPEQLRSEKLDRRSDVFSSGIVVWETLVQRHLFRRETDFLTFQAITAEPIPDVCVYRPEIPPKLGDAIAKALAPNREDRWPTTRAFGEALVNAVAPLGGPPTPSVIAEEIMRAFAPQLEEQRALTKLARQGVMLDLVAEQQPALAPGTELMTTPASSLRSPPASAPSVEPTAPVAKPRRSLALPIAAVLTIAGGVVMHLVLRDRSTTEGTTIALAAIDAGLASPAIDASVSVVTANVPLVEDAGIAAFDAAVATPDAALVATPDAAVAATPARAPAKPKPAVKSPPGTITIDASPYATIFIDGKAVGETPLFALSLPPGPHVLRAVSPTGEVRTMRIVIESGKVAPPRRIVW